MKHALKLTAALALGLAACESAEKASTDSTEALAAAEAAVQQRLPIMGTATQAGDVDALIDLWASDVALYESGVVMTGEEQARQVMGQFMGMLKVSDLNLTATETVAHDGGAVVYQFGYLTQTLKPSQGGPDIPVRNNFALRWMPNAQGVWEMHRYVSTPAPNGAEAPPAVTPARSTLPALEAAAVQSQIEQRTNELVEAIRSGDGARIGAVFTDDAHFFEPETQQIGRPAIEAFMTQASAAYGVESLEVKPIETFVHDSGSVAYQFGGYTEVLVEKATSKKTAVSNSYLLRWRRDASGAWRVDRFLATMAPDPSRQY